MGGNKNLTEFLKPSNRNLNNVGKIEYISTIKVVLVYNQKSTLGTKIDGR